MLKRVMQVVVLFCCLALVHRAQADLPKNFDAEQPVQHGKVEKLTYPPKPSASTAPSSSTPRPTTRRIRSIPSSTSSTVPATTRPAGTSKARPTISSTTSTPTKTP